MRERAKGKRWDKDMKVGRERMRRYWGDNRETKMKGYPGTVMLLMVQLAPSYLADVDGATYTINNRWCKTCTIFPNIKTPSVLSLYQYH